MPESSEGQQDKAKRTGPSPRGRELVRQGAQARGVVEKVRRGGSPAPAGDSDVQKLNRVAPAIQAMLADTSLKLAGVTRLRIELHESETVIAALTHGGQTIFRVQEGK